MGNIDEKSLERMAKKTFRIPQNLFRNLADTAAESGAVHAEAAISWRDDDDDIDLDTYVPELVLRVRLP
jgi:hypothetical protein